MQFRQIKLGVVILIDKVILACLLILGCYFIHQGDVLGRFRLKRTNFAEYGEPIMEFPTITTFINHRNTPQHLRLGSDYNMTFWTFGYKFAAGWEKTNLSLGDIDLKGSGLRVRVDEQLFWVEDEIRISPLNFNSGLPHAIHAITFNFSHQSSVSRVGIILTTQNNSCGNDDPGSYTYFDGEISEVTAKVDKQGYLGNQRKWLTVYPQKRVFSKVHKNCRDNPYQEILLSNILAKMKQICQKPCRPSDKKYCYISDKVKRIPICQAGDSEKCFYEAQKAERKNVIVKPCTKLEYQVAVDTDKSHYDAEFVIQFADPPRVEVKEEYLIYDLVSMVSAIGGTMGLCIGFSFKELSRWMLEHLVIGLECIYARLFKRYRENSLQENVELGLQINN